MESFTWTAAVWYQGTSKEVRLVLQADAEAHVTTHVMLELHRGVYRQDDAWRRLDAQG